MASKLKLVIFTLTFLFFQNPNSVFATSNFNPVDTLIPEKKINTGTNRLEIKSIKILKKKDNSAKIEYNIVNTGKNRIRLGTGEGIPKDLIVDFDKSLDVNQLTQYKNDIIESLKGQNFAIRPGQLMMSHRMKVDFLTHSKNEEIKIAKEEPAVVEPEKIVQTEQPTLTKELVMSSEKENTKVDSVLDTKPIEEVVITVLPKEEFLTEEKVKEFPAKEEILVEEKMTEVPAKEETLVEEKVTEVPAKAEILVEEKVTEVPVKAEILVEEKVTEVLVKEEILVEEKITEVPVKAEMLGEEKITEVPVKAEMLGEEKITEVPVKEEMLVEEKVTEVPVKEETLIKEEITKEPQDQKIEDSQVVEIDNEFDSKKYCPDLILENIKILKQSKRVVVLEYTLTNKGKGPAQLFGPTIQQEDNISIRAHLSRTKKLTRGAIPLNGIFISKEVKSKDGFLAVDESLTGKMKVDLRKMTQFTPILILTLDPFQTVHECNELNNFNFVELNPAAKEAEPENELQKKDGETNRVEGLSNLDPATKNK